MTVIENKELNCFPQDDYESILVLLIDRVYDQHFRSYYFEAENKLGKVIHEVELLMGTFSIA